MDTFQVGDLVWVRTPEQEVPGVVTAVRTYSAPYDNEVGYDVDTILAGIIDPIGDDVRAMDVPTPAEGQRWQCITRPDLILTVDSVSRGGLLTDCKRPDGRWVQSVCLLGYYRPVEVA